ncbi:hypothetical protein PVK06_026643 [Gossypium arboreum]|uniref:Uncharacterized protein n=1 Tax=Gossypium arboreum TaxID=29729 RepID=A0ABR0P131_GOSAR|nr:hypothetical protein PVK06_026643 [Gossypium arboreum]
MEGDACRSSLHYAPYTGVLMPDTNGNKMDHALDLQPSLEYIQWYSEMRKPFLVVGQSMVVPPHMTRLGQPSYPLLHLPPTPELEAEPELHSRDSFYHPNLGAMTIFQAR